MEVSATDEMKKWFVIETRQSFPVDRFNHFLKNLNLLVVCIVAVKDGEDVIQSGHDV
jgi:hypothetical protein